MPLKKSVSFGEISIEKLQATPVEEKKALWYNDEDLKNIRIEMEIQAMEGDFGRGLESLDDSNNSHTRRKQLISTVLALQEEHRENKLVDDKGLARMASALTKDCLKRARRRASADSVDAFRSYSEHLAHLLKTRNEEEFAKPAKVAVTRKIPRRASTMSAMKRPEKVDTRRKPMRRSCTMQPLARNSPSAA